MKFCIPNCPFHFSLSLSPPPPVIVLFTNNDPSSDNFPITLFLMASQYANDWQSTKKTVLERNSHMFNNPLMSDIKFTCGESKRKYFHAHKYVLATSSTVFYAMFYGELAEKCSTIHLPDTDEEGLEMFLRFLYTEVYKMTTEVAIKVVYLAKKYIVPSLTEKCVEVLLESLRPDNAVTVLEQALHFDEKELEKKCLEVVESEAGKVIASEAFCHISRETLIYILKRDKLYDIKEIELFKAVLKWSDVQCAKNGSVATEGKRREIIGNALYQIRFLAMSEREFEQNVSRSGLLTAEEVSSIRDTFSGLESSALKWKQSARRPLIKRFKRFDLADIVAAGPYWNYKGLPKKKSPHENCDCFNYYQVVARW